MNYKHFVPAATILFSSLTARADVPLPSTVPMSQTGQAVALAVGGSLLGPALIAAMG
jgi:hypothetical protein